MDIFFQTNDEGNSGHVTSMQSVPDTITSQKPSRLFLIAVRFMSSFLSARVALVRKCKRDPWLHDLVFQTSRCELSTSEYCLCSKIYNMYAAFSMISLKRRTKKQIYHDTHI